MKVGSGGLTFEVVEEWGHLPVGWDLVEVGGVGVDSQDRVYVFNRGAHPIVVFDRHGNFVTAWGEGTFKNAHGIRIGADGSVWCVDAQDHTVRKFTSDGKLLMTIGVSGRPSDTGYVQGDRHSVKRVGPPFNSPTNMAFSPQGDFYVTDGYGNARVHKFSPDGELLFSWGEPGVGPGQFHAPHGIWVHRDGTVYVGDRHNNRIQVFGPQGEFITLWPEVYIPSDVLITEEDHVFVAEVGYLADRAMWGPAPATEADSWPRVTIRNLDGEILVSITGPDPHAPGQFAAPHSLAMDSRGDLYVGEVCKAQAKVQGIDPEGLHPLQKFARVRT
jgi:DNA-binding beta-propeller fold protein YncE